MEVIAVQKKIDDSVVELERLDIGYSSPIYAMSAENAGEHTGLISKSIKDIEMIEKDVAERLEGEEADSSIESDDLDLIGELNKDVIERLSSFTVKQTQKKVTTRNLDIF
jgi:hypothetical protein